MRSPPATPLTDDELDRLDAWLDAAAGPITDAEALDGFLVALVIGPDLVLPSQYLQLVFGAGKEGEEDAGVVFQNMAEAQDALNLVQRHWNRIADTLARNKYWLPLVTDVEEDLPGKAWAHGFLTGVDLSRKSWKSFINDDDLAGPLVPIYMLAHEDDPDPELRPPPITPELRNELIIALSGAITSMHRHFLKQRRGTTAPPPRVGRNAPCPCGSGRTYKRCCGRPG